MRNLAITELVIKVYLNKDIKEEECGNLLCELINIGSINDEELTKLHNMKIKNKNYSVSYLEPRERDFVYKEDKIYTFYIKSLDKHIIYRMQRVINNIKINTLKILKTSVRTINKPYINEIVVSTPAVRPLGGDKKGSYLLPNHDLDQVRQMMEDNLARKYKDIYGETIEKRDFIQYIEVTNKVPLKVLYKGITFLGNRYRIMFNMDKLSQNMAKVAVATGIFSKSTSAACGFVKIIG